MDSYVRYNLAPKEHEHTLVALQNTHWTLIWIWVELSLGASFGAGLEQVLTWL